MGNAPESLSNMLELGGSERTKKLKERSFNGDYGERSFSVAGPKLWNLLPTDLRLEEDTDEFKKQLKTFLFREVDNPNSRF